MPVAGAGTNISSRQRPWPRPFPFKLPLKLKLKLQLKLRLEGQHVAELLAIHEHTVLPVTVSDHSPGAVAAASTAPCLQGTVAAGSSCTARLHAAFTSTAERCLQPPCAFAAEARLCEAAAATAAADCRVCGAPAGSSIL